MRQQGIVGIFVLLILALAIAGGAYYLKAYEGKFCGGFAGNLPENQCPFGYTCRPDSPKGNDTGGKCESLLGSVFEFNANRSSSGKACTQEAKICPDGSTVSKVGPNCEFTKCPGEGDETTNWKTYVSPLGFSVKAPASFKQGCKFGDTEIEEFCIESLGTKKEFQDKDIEGGGAWVVTQGGVLAVSQDKEANLPLTKEAVCNPGGGIKVLSCEEVTLDGVPAFKRIDEDPERMTIFALKDDISYTTSLWYSDLEAKQLLDQILYTFRFTSQ